MIKAVIFDMDGTVCDTISSIAYFGNNALNKYGLPSIPRDRYKILVGNGAKVLVERMIAETGGRDDLFDAVYEEYSETYNNDFLYLTEPYEGVLDMLDSLNKAGIRCTILSNKPDETAKKVSDSLFGDSIEICYGGRSGKPLKPDPQVVLEMLDEMGISKDECLYVGDTATDMKTGKSAGLFTIGVLWGFRDREELEGASADLIVSHPSEIVKAAASR